VKWSKFLKKREIKKTMTKKWFVSTDIVKIAEKRPPTLVSLVQRE
jgi:hypothetical protein